MGTQFYYLSTTPSQDGFKNQAELPRGVRGYHQPADQHGVLRQLRLSIHELLVQQRRTSFSWIRQVLQEGVRGERARNEAHGVPGQQRRQGGLQGHRQTEPNGMGK